MAKTKQEKIEGIQAEIKQLENQMKELIQKQKEDARKARTKRLCSRGGYLESRLPETITLTDEQYKILLEKTLFTEYAREILNGLTVQNAEKTAETQENVTEPNGADIELEPIMPTAHYNTIPAEKPIERQAILTPPSTWNPSAPSRTAVQTGAPTTAASQQ